MISHRSFKETTFKILRTQKKLQIYNGNKVEQRLDYFRQCYIPAAFFNLFFFKNPSLCISHQPVHNSGSSGYGSPNRNDPLLGMTSSSESLDNCSGSKTREAEEEISSKVRPVSEPKHSQFSTACASPRGPACTGLVPGC